MLGNSRNMACNQRHARQHHRHRSDAATRPRTKPAIRPPAPASARTRPDETREKAGGARARRSSAAAASSCRWRSRQLTSTLPAARAADSQGRPAPRPARPAAGRDRAARAPAGSRRGGQQPARRCRYAGISGCCCRHHLACGSSASGGRGCSSSDANRRPTAHRDAGYGSSGGRWPGARACCPYSSSCRNSRSNSGLA